MRIISLFVLAIALPAGCWHGDSVATPPIAATVGVQTRSFPGGITDASERIGYVSNATGALEAIDLDTGHTIWTSQRGSQALAVVTRSGATQVAALALDPQAPTRPRVTIFDATSGTFVRVSEPIALPDWATTAVRGGSSFSIHAIGAGDPLVLEWHAATSWWSGIAPPPNYKGQDAVGRVEIWLSTGAVHVQAGAAARDDAGAQLSSARDLKSSQVLTNGRWSTAPLVAGSRVAVLVREVEPLSEAESRRGVIPYERLSLRSWNRTSGAELPTILLLRGRGVFVQTTADGRDLVLFQAIARTDLSHEEDVYSVFSIEGGILIAKIPRMHDGGAEIGASGTHVFVVVAGAQTSTGATESTARTLLAFDARTGHQLWAHALTPSTMLLPPP
jgi:hypothetical protein